MIKKFLLLFALWFAAFHVEAALDSSLLADFKRFEKVSECTYRITSGYRTKAHNAKIGGSKNSFHLVGKALDIQPKCKKSLEELGKIAMTIFNGVIVYPNHIHIDNREGKKYHSFGGKYK